MTSYNRVNTLPSDIPGVTRVTGVYYGYRYTVERARYGYTWNVVGLTTLPEVPVHGAESEMHYARGAAMLCIKKTLKIPNNAT